MNIETVAPLENSSFEESFKDILELDEKVYWDRLAGRLKETIEEAENQDQLEMLMLMVEGRRLRDISDLPFDLAI